MAINYQHPKLGEEIRTLAGYYILNGEHTLDYNDKKILYITGSTCVDAACCGVGNWNFIQVPGYILKSAPEGESGSDRISEIEPIKGEQERREILHILQEMHPNANIEMW